MKVGIITITTGENYGNRLQNYAVQEALKDMGFEPETIHKVTNVFDAEQAGYLRKLRVKRILHYHLTKEEERRLNFYDFTRKYIKRSKFIIDRQIPKGLDEAYDYFVAGSDQVWNPYLEYCTDANFLVFTENHKKIAFAPSIAVSSIPEDKKESFQKWIGDFRLLSVREQEGSRLIWELCWREAEVLGDPTLYLSAEKWRKIEKKVDILENSYILTYFLGECTEEYRSKIETLAAKHHLSVLQLQSEENYGFAPDEFLYLIDHAALICTDSFHGTLFSIVFHRPFLVFERREKFADMGSRLDTLLTMFSLETRCQEVQEEDVFSMDFSGIDQRIETERKKMQKFLKKIDRSEQCE